MEPVLPSHAQDEPPGATRRSRLARHATVLRLGVGFATILAHAASSGLQAPADPFCSSSELAELTSPPPVQSPGTRRMIERLARIQAESDPASMPYLVARRVPVLEQEIAASTNATTRIRLRAQLAAALVQSGRASDAIAAYKGIRADAGRTGGSMADQAGVSARDLRLGEAMAWLRVGEDENCVANHGPMSCLFPIPPEGIHRLERGSRAARALLGEQLSAAPGDLRARWLFNLAAMTLGEWPAKVPDPWLIPPETFAPEEPFPRFPDVAGSLGLDVDDLAGGCILDDFDNDGRIDVVASSWSLQGQLRIFRNDGDGHFVERTAAAALTGLVGGLNIQQTDYNNDGWLDIWVLRGGWLRTAGRIPNSLLRNNGDGTFTDVTDDAGLLTLHPSQTSVWFDFDGDGWLDVFVGNETWDSADPDPCQLFRNNGDGTFSDCARDAGLDVRRLVKGAASADYDLDGRPDLYLSCLDGPNLLFHNDGPATGSRGNPGGTGAVPWRFSDRTERAGLAETIHSFPTWFFDFDNDGREDLFVSGFQIRDVGDVAADYLGQRHQAAMPRLYRNQGDGTFRDATAEMRLNRLCHAMGANFGDLDNDGWLDVFLATGDPELSTLVPNRVFRNAEGRVFREITSAGGFGHLQKGHGVGFADLDEDGDQDVYVVLGGAYPADHYPNALFQNPGNGNRWLKLTLEGSRANRAAIGARIRVTARTSAGLRTICRTVNSGGSFGSSTLRQEFGLGDATSIVRVEIDWPGSGTRQVLTGLEPNRSYRVREGDAQAVR